MSNCECINVINRIAMVNCATTHPHPNIRRTPPCVTVLCGLHSFAEEMADGDDDTVASHQWQLPNEEFEDMWDSYVSFDEMISSLLTRVVYCSLYFDTGIK